MIPPDWVDLGRLLVETGFFGLAAFLLWERYHTSEKREAQRTEGFDKVARTIDALSIVIRDQTTALVRIVDRFDEQTRWLQNLQHEVRLQTVITKTHESPSHGKKRSHG